MKRLFVFSLIICLIIFSCTKIPVDPFTEFTAECKGTLEQSITCQGIQSTYYFHGFLDGKEVCFSDGIDNYSIFNNISISFVTSGPVLNPADSTTLASRKRQLEFGIRANDFDQNANSPYFSIIVSSKQANSVQEFLANLFKTGDLPFAQALFGDSTQTSGFNIKINDYCKDVHNLLPKGDSSTFTQPINAYTYYYWSIGNQTNSTFKCTQFKTTVGDVNIFYDLTFEINCNLYSGTVLWHKLKDAKFVTRFIVKK